MKNRFIILDEDKDFTGEELETEVGAVHRAKERMGDDNNAKVFYVAEIIGEAKRASPPVFYERFPPRVRPKKARKR